jgi:hypothetical protein
MAGYKNTGLRSNSYAEEVRLLLEMGAGRLILSHDEASGRGYERSARLPPDGPQGRAEDHPERNGMCSRKEQDDADDSHYGN